MTHSKWRGHPIEHYAKGLWVYSDTKEPVAGYNRPCGNCGQMRTPEGYDACIGTLPNVMNACCGHGEIKDAYIEFADGSRLDGEAACDGFRRLSKNKPRSKK